MIASASGDLVRRGKWHTAKRYAAPTRPTHGRHTRRALETAAIPFRKDCFTELRSFLESGLHKLGTDIAVVQTETSRRIEAAEQALAVRPVEASNGLPAHLGEVEDKIDRTIQSRG